MKRRHGWAVGVLAVGVTAFVMLGPTTAEPPPPAAVGLLGERSAQLAEVRKSGRIEELTAFIDAQRARAEAKPTDPVAWRVLAEAYLERCLARSGKKGMAVGKPTHEELPPGHSEDIAAGLAALARARESGGSDDPEVFRIEAALYGLRVTSWASALAERPAIAKALEKAKSLRPDHPRVLIALGCERLFAPRFLGHDAAGAKAMFLSAAAALPDDERPLVLASMAAHLLGEHEEAIDLLERACALNPNNRYAATVLQRLRAGEDDPFGRDV